MEYIIKCNWDPDAGVWYSESDRIPVVLESDSLDTLIQRVLLAAPELAELNGLPKPRCLYFLTEARKEVGISFQFR